MTGLLLKKKFETAIALPHPDQRIVQITCSMNSQDLRYCTSEKTMYDKYSLQQPDFVSTIEVLIQEGHSPTDIENFMRLVTATGSQLADHVYWVASYILRQQISQN